MSTQPLTLVTTPNGRTGSAAITELLRLGMPVRAMVRADDARAQRLRAAGAEVVVGDFFDWRDLKTALAGVKRVYHCPPFDARILHGSMLLALAAEEAKVEVVALMSAWNPHPSHPAIAQREHWIANNLYRRMPSVDVIHINPGLFAFIYLLGLPAIVHMGMLAGPWGNGLNAAPSNEDIGAVAAAALANPEPYIGRSLRPTGPELLSPQDVAGVLSRVTGRKVTYRDVPTSMFLKAATAQGIPTGQIAQVRHYMEELRNGAFSQDPTDHVLEVTGRAPEGFESIARRYLANPDLIVPGLKAGSRFSALAFLARMIVTPVPDLDRWERSRDYPLIANGELAHENPRWVEAASAARLLLQPEPGMVASTEFPRPKVVAMR